VSGAQRERMYSLLAQYFTDTVWEAFERDLAEKEWVILLEDTHTGTLEGFSTLMRLELRVDGDGRPVVAFFSGDTIVGRPYWGETALPRTFARHAFALAAAERRVDPTVAVYWYLISSGYKTYRFLPVFFREFYPTYARTTPAAVQRILDALGRRKFPREYDAAAGVVRPAHPSALRAGVAEIEPRHLLDPHVAFFAAANPGHAAGDELACLTALHPANLTPAGRRMLYEGAEPPC
jgi:hypothetical protein